ncbi:hypothetical protein HPB49_009251 [Dermacentor silvarum]|uniref:Uncharacterized protein n=1 Tax=Dermacentor silvarum TaxID=543639 RepID=A0ACB8CE48_DERSI|nr:hypothetical protein HPB49_009251 [Dermacentor silvarum]
MRPVIYWPSRSTTQLMMPNCFKPDYVNCRVLIDCTEVPCAAPSTVHENRLVGSVTGLHSTLLREIFIQLLPNNVRVALTTVAEKDLGKLAAITNAVIGECSAPSSNELLELREEIAHLTDTVAALQARTSRPLKQRIAPPQQPRLRWS